MANKILPEIYDPHLKVSKYQWGEKEGTDKMKSMTPGQQDSTKKMSTKKIPYLFMSREQKDKLNEEKMQLVFDGVETKSFDMCPTAYKLFSKMIDDIRNGVLQGEPTGHITSTAKRMKFKYYTEQ